MMNNSPIQVEIIHDSISPYTGARITTLAATYHRYIHSEVMTHRAFSRSAASSRAIPIKKWIEQVRLDPAMPIAWRENGPGMVPGEPMNELDEQACRGIWLQAAQNAAASAEALASLGLHKQWTNRLLEPFQFIQTLITATDWQNFFDQRIGHGAQDEFDFLARLIRYRLETSVPVMRRFHLPYLTDEETALPPDETVKYSVARCGRISYLRHTTIRDREKDVERHDSFITGGHWGPLEHAAAAAPSGFRFANFQGWASYRWLREQEIEMGEFLDATAPMGWARESNYTPATTGAGSANPNESTL